MCTLCIHIQCHRSFYQITTSDIWRQCKWDHDRTKCTSSKDGSVCAPKNLDKEDCSCPAKCPEELGEQAGVSGDCSHQSATSTSCASLFYRETGGDWRQCIWRSGAGCRAGGSVCQAENREQKNCACPAKCQSHVLPGKCKDKGKNTCETCAYI